MSTGGTRGIRLTCNYEEAVVWLMTDLQAAIFIAIVALMVVIAVVIGAAV